MLETVGEVAVIARSTVRHIRQSWLNLLVAASFVFCILISERACKAEVNPVEHELSQVIENLRDVEQSIRALSVTNEWTMKLPDEEIVGYVHSAKGTETVLVECHGSRGRIRCDSRGESVVDGVNGSAGNYRATSVFDGELVKRMQGGEQYISGTISQQKSQIHWKFDPRLAVSHFFRRTVSELLEKKGGQITGLTNLDNIPVLVIETASVKKDVERRYRFHVAPSLNFAVVRRAIEAKLLDHEKWLEYRVVECADYEEFAPGIWLPVRVIERNYMTEERHFIEDIERPISAELRMNMVNWVVNPEVADELFTLEFPSGIRVTNQVTGKTFNSELDEARVALKEGKLPRIEANEWMNTEGDLSWQNLKGKVVLFDFWSTSCGPCLAKLPLVQQLHDELSDQGLVIIAVHAAANNDAWKEYLNEKKFTFPAAVDSGKTAKAFVISALPNYFLFDRNHKLMQGFSPKMPERDLIESLLAE